MPVSSVPKLWADVPFATSQRLNVRLSDAGCKMMLEQCTPDDVSVTVNMGCVLYKEAKYNEAHAK